MTRHLLLALSLCLAIPMAGHAQLTFTFAANAGGFWAGGTGTGPWFWGTFGTPPIGSNAWQILGNSTASTQVITSPLLRVLANGNVTGALLHRFQLESTFDGGQLQFSHNGSAFQTIPRQLLTTVIYTNQIDAGANSALAGQWAFTGTSSNFSDPAYITTDLTLGTGASPFDTGTTTNFLSNDTLQFRFLAVTNDANNDGNPAWQLGQLNLTNVTLASVPEPATMMVLASASAIGLAGYRKWNRRSSRTHASRKACS